MPESRKVWWAHGFLLACILLFYRPILFDSSSMLPWDFSGYHLPQAVFLAESLHAGELPLWDPYVYCGRPFAANIQTQTLYPPRLASAFLGGFGGLRGIAYALELEQVIHVYCAALLAFWLARRLTLGPVAAALSGVAYSCGCYFASQAEHIGAVESACWLPLAWLGVILMAEGRLASGLVALTGSLAATFFCGFTPMALITYGSVLLLGSFCIRGRRAGYLALAAGVCAVLVASIQVLPTLELAGLSVARWRTDWMGTGGGIPPSSLVTMIRPDYFHVFDIGRYSGGSDPTFRYLYCGWVTLALVLIGLFHRRAGRRPIALALLLGLAAVLMLGDQTPPGRWLFQALPQAFERTYYPHHWMAPFSLCVALLAGFGMERLRSRPLAGVVLLAAAALDTVWVSSGRPLNTAKADPQAADQALLDEIRKVSYARFPPSRIDTVDDSAMWSQWAPVTHVPSASGYDPLALIRIIQVRLGFAHGERWGAYYQVQDPRSPLVGLLNVEQLVNHRVLSRNPGVQPRFFFASSVTRVPDMTGAVRMIRRPDWDPRSNAVVETDRPAMTGPGVGRVDVVSYRARSLELRTENEANGFLVAADAHYPGWRAFIDGAETPILYTDVAFRGVAVPAGRHTVSFRFEPRIFLWGSGLSLIGVCLTAGLALKSSCFVGTTYDNMSHGLKWPEVVQSAKRSEIDAGGAPARGIPRSCR